MPIYSPTSLREAVDIYAEHDDASLIAGGTDFMVEVNFNHRKPSTVISLSRIDELKNWHIDTEQSVVRIGSTVPFSVMEKADFAKYVPALSHAARTVGSPQIRNTASLGGNLGTCSPAGDSLPVLSALDAQIELFTASGMRQVSIHDFMLGPKRNALTPGEIVSAIVLPVTNGFQDYAKVGVRNAMVISIASACFAIQDEVCRIALGSVGPTIIRCREAEEFLQQEMSDKNIPTTDSIQEFAQLVASEARPIDDHRSTATYRRHAIEVMARRLAMRSFSL
jgi:CO/xanthine dehydrogenase FAD-binding subunit